MQSLLAFLRKHQFFTLFILLEFLSFFLLSHSYSYHKSLHFNAVNDLSGNLFSNFNSIESYFLLKKENKELLTENAKLQNKLKSSFLSTDTTFAYSDSLYKYMSAKVVSNSVNQQNNFMLINKGTLHGIEKEMGVISGHGIAGIVIGTSKHYARVMSILHQNTRISGRIKKNNQLVNIIWDGKSYMLGLVNDIPSHVLLEAGDTIISSGNSLIFPEGIIIGTIVDQTIAENKNLGEATLAFSTDFNSLQYVYLIKNKMKPEQDSLVNANIN